jgi:peroxiredoxin
MHTHILTEVIQYYNEYLKIAEDHDRKKREKTSEKEKYRSLTNSVHTRACKTTTRTYEEQQEDKQEEAELYKIMLKSLTAQQQLTLVH